MQSAIISNRDAILGRIAQGERLTDIAVSLGYKDHTAIVHRLSDDPAYQAAREAGVEARMEARESEMESATDSVTVARARELLGHARWRAEREFPSRWGVRQQVSVEVVDFRDVLAGVATRVSTNMRGCSVMSNGDAAQQEQAQIVDETERRGGVE